MVFIPTYNPLDYSLLKIISKIDKIITNNIKIRKYMFRFLSDFISFTLANSYFLSYIFF